MTCKFIATTKIVCDGCHCDIKPGKGIHARFIANLWETFHPECDPIEFTQPTCKEIFAGEPFGARRYTIEDHK